MDGVDVLRDCAAVAGVGAEHGWEGVESGGGLLITRDHDSCALHVHLAVALTIPPEPGDDSFAGGEARRDFEVEKREDLGWVWREVAEGSVDGVVAFP